MKPFVCVILPSSVYCVYITNSRVQLEYWMGAHLPSGSRLKGEWGGVMGDTGVIGAERLGWKWLW